MGGCSWPVGSGKTTLLTSLYELFQWNKVPNYIFAGSEHCRHSKSAAIYHGLHLKTQRRIQHALFMIPFRLICT